MKRLLVCILLAICITGICGCGRGIVEQIDTSGYEDENINKDNYLLERMNADLDGKRMYDGSYCYSQGKMYYAAYDETETNDSEQKKYVYGYDIGSSDNKALFEINDEVEGEAMVWNVAELAVNSSGDIELYCFAQTRQNDGLIKSEIKKYVYSTTGECKDIFDIDLGQVSIVSAKCYADNAGNIYVLIMDDENWEISCRRYDSSGNMSGLFKYTAYINISYLDSKERIVVCANEADGQVYGAIDFEQNKLDKEMFSGLKDEGMAEIIGIYDTGLYFNGSDSIYTYDYETGEYQSLVNLSLNNLEGCYIKYFSKTDDGYICAVENEGAVTSEMYALKKSDDTKEQDTIVIAAINDNDTELLSYVNQYNREMKDWRIEFRNYGVQSETPYNDLLKDIMTGNAPDIFVTNNMNLETLITKGMLEDMGKYIDKDKILNKDYFADGFLDAMKIDGYQYVLTNNICIETLAGRKNDVSSFENKWNLDALTECYNNKSNINLIDDSSAVEIFTKLFEADITEYIDFKNTSCNFNSDEFRKLLEFCRKLPDNKCEDSMLRSVTISEPANIQYIDTIYEHQAAYTGYPSYNGGQSFITSQSAVFAIYSASENKEKAWNIIKELMTGDYGKYSYGSGNGIPVSKEEFNNMVHDVTITEKYTDETGVTIYPQSMQIGSENISIGPASDEDIAMLKALITKSTFRISYDDIAGMVAEEVNSYYQKEKTLENVVDVIQDKVTKYINENAE